MKTETNKSEIIMPNLLLLQNDGIQDDLINWEFRVHVIDTLERTRAGAVSDVGGINSYLHTHNFDGEISTFKGYVSEHFRNYHERNSFFSEKSNDEQFDRHMGETHIQDYSGNSIYDFNNKLFTDGDADRFQVTDEFYGKLVHYLDENPSSQIAEHIAKHWEEIHPDSEFTGHNTSTEWYEQHTNSGLDRALQPILYSIKDVGVREAEAAIMLMAMGVLVDSIKNGKIDSQTIKRIGTQLPSNMLRYTLTSGLSLGLTNLAENIFHEFALDNAEKWVGENTNIVVPGIGFLTISAIKLFKFMNGEISQRQLQTSLTRGATGIMLTTATKILTGKALATKAGLAAGKAAHIAAGDASGGIVTATVIIVSIVYTASTSYLDCSRMRKYDNERIEATYEYLSNITNLGQLD